MKRGLLRNLGALVLIALASAMLPKGAEAQSKLAAGVLSGVVRDASGTPQMGASVEVLSESIGLLAVHDFLTNTRGNFRGEQLPPGLYTVRVTLAGFLPTIEQHVRISANLTTMVRIEMESMFASIERMRRQPANTNAEADDWKWVLRSAPSLRPVLEWTDSNGSGVYGQQRAAAGAHAAGIYGWGEAAGFAVEYRTRASDCVCLRSESRRNGPHDFRQSNELRRRCARRRTGNDLAALRDAGSRAAYRASVARGQEFGDWPDVSRRAN